MTDKPTITKHYGDYVEFTCVCGAEHDLVFDGGNTDPCEGCGRVWGFRSEVFMVEGPKAADEGSSDASVVRPMFCTAESYHPQAGLVGCELARDHLGNHYASGYYWSVPDEGATDGR